MNIQKRIWLTGASSGMGLEMAKQLAEQGHKLALTARSARPLLELSDRYPGQILVITADLTCRHEVRAAGERICANWGALDLVILNAGTCEYMELPHFDSELFARVMQTNVQGTANCIEAAIPLLRAGNSPQLVGVGSSVTYLPLPRAEAYGASKAAIRYLFQSLELDLAKWNIKVSLVSPGFVDTPLTAANDFPMPMQISSEKAASTILRGIARRQREIRFPTVFISLLRLLGSLPASLRVLLTHRRSEPDEKENEKQCA